MIKLLIPDMPCAAEVLPYLRKIDETQVYVNGGPLVRTLQNLVSSICSGPAAVVSNATVGLELALRALALRPGARVLVPAVTYVASGQAIRNAGLVPVLADVNAKTWQLDPGAVFDALNDDPALAVDAVMPVAAFGAPVPILAWDIFAANTGLPVVIDAAGALTEQDASAHPLVTTVYSMHATKFFGCGEGGVVTSCNEERVARIRDMACFGPGGTNAKMSEYHAGVAMAQFARLSGKALRTGRVFGLYARSLPEILVDTTQTMCKVIDNHTLLPLLLPDWLGADVAAKFMEARGIETRCWYRPFLNERTDFIDCERAAAMPVTDRLAKHLLGVPFHTRLEPVDVDTVCSALADLLATNG